MQRDPVRVERWISRRRTFNGIRFSVKIEAARCLAGIKGKPYVQFWRCSEICNKRDCGSDKLLTVNDFSYFDTWLQVFPMGPIALPGSGIGWACRERNLCQATFEPMSLTRIPMNPLNHPLPSAAPASTRALPIFTFAVLVLAVAGLISLPAKAEPVSGREAPLMNVVSLSASGFLEVQQDWLTLRMNVTREGGDAASVQTQLKTAVDSALAIARGAAAANQQMQVRSGSFGVYPRYDKSGKISNWQGNAELILDGRDFTRIARTAGQITSMTVAGMDFSLSREAQQKLETDVQALAIERFRARATEVAKGFGMTSYGLGEINISSADQMEGRVFARSAMAMDANASLSKSEPLAVEPGNSKVNVTVSGTVHLK